MDNNKFQLLLHTSIYSFVKLKHYIVKQKYFLQLTTNFRLFIA